MDTTAPPLSIATMADITIEVAMAVVGDGSASRLSFFKTGALSFSAVQLTNGEGNSLTCRA